jgi:hypothetical protein
MKVFYLYIYVFSLILFSCGERVRISPLPDATTLKVVKSKDLGVFPVRDIQIADSLLLLLNIDTCCSPMAFHLYSCSSLEKIDEAGVLGMAPGKLQRPAFTNLSEESGHFVIKNELNPDFFLLDINAIIQKGKEPVLSIPAPGKELNSPGVVKITEDDYLLCGAVDKPQSLYNKKNQKRKDLPFIRYSGNLDYLNNLMINNVKVAANKERKVFWAAMDILDRVILFSKNGKALKQIVFSSPEVSAPGKFKHYFGDIYSAKKYCYVTRPDEIKNSGSPRLLVFDWKGRLVKTYRSPVGFGELAVSEEGQIYTTIASKTNCILYELSE